MNRLVYCLLSVFTFHLGVTAQTGTPINIVTPYNNIVQDTYVLTNGQNPNFNSYQMAVIESHLYNNYDGATIVGDADYRYNCHAYAWHVSEGGNLVWIGWNYITSEDIYWNDGSYIEVPEIEATKVSYHELGNHSAISIGGGWYQSKWGPSFLVRHKLNEVLCGNSFPFYEPTDYHPELIKKFYRRATIIGDKVPSCSSVYEIEGLPSYYDVSWNFENQPTLSSSLIIQNTPSNNKCTIINNGIDFYDTNLVASIKKNGQVAETLLKHIQSDIPVTFSQQGNTYNGVVYPDIPDSPITKNGNIFVNKSCWITLKSSYFTSMSVSYTGASIIWSQMNDGSISLKFPYSTGTSYVDVNAIGGCRDFSFRIYARTGSIPVPFLEATPIANGYNIVLYSQDENGKKMDLQNEVDLQWDLLVYNTSLGELMFKKHTRSCTEEINTSSWPSGVYVVRAIMFGQEATCKIIVKN